MHGKIAILAALAIGVSVIGISAPAPSLAQGARPADSGAGLVNDYPTEARADYVFTCMAANGQTRETLRRCSCSVDVVASILPYERYVEAETVLAMRQVSGERVGMMRTAPMANDLVRDLRRAQAEGDVRCF
ncbi:hypothetical protein [Amaricoccus sp. W119]|uniref:hypothetical protein n=1 Tax=Amaricoccus sp. W119 TaxID=3391833 RepID=UPI0039A68678